MKLWTYLLCPKNLKLGVQGFSSSIDTELGFGGIWESTGVRSRGFLMFVDEKGE